MKGQFLKGCKFYNDLFKNWCLEFESPVLRCFRVFRLDLVLNLGLT